MGYGEFFRKLVALSMAYLTGRRHFILHFLSELCS
jgi:hypothetical protein